MKYDPSNIKHWTSFTFVWLFPHKWFHNTWNRVYSVNRIETVWLVKSIVFSIFQLYRCVVMRFHEFVYKQSNRHRAYFVPRISIGMPSHEAELCSLEFSSNSDTHVSTSSGLVTVLCSVKCTRKPILSELLWDQLLIIRIFLANSMRSVQHLCDKWQVTSS